jgi:O-antigen/teichoic acid export membrane protein
VLKKLGRDVAIYGGADLAFRLAQFLVIPIYAHQLSVGDFGILALLTVTAQLLGMLLNFGVTNSVQRFYFDPEVPESARPAVVSTGFFQLLVSGTVTIAVAYVGLKAFSGPIDSDYHIAWPLILVALLTVFPDQIAQYTLDAVRLQFAPLKFCAIALVKNLAGVLLGLWFLMGLDMGILGLLLGNLIAAVAAVPIGVLMIRRDLTRKLDRKIAVKVFHYGYPFVLAGAAYWVFGSMDRWMLIELSDVTQLGLFSVALKFAASLTFVIMAFAQAWNPYAMRMRTEDPLYRENFARVFSLWFFLLALLGLGLALLSPEVMMLLTPRTYWGAAPIMAVCATGVVLYGTVQLTVLGIVIERKTMLLNYGAWLAAGANVVVNLVLIPRMGAMGAAVSTLFSYGLLTGSLLFWSQRLHPIPLERGKLLYCCLVTLGGMAAALALIPLGIGIVPFAIKAAIVLAVIAGAFATHILDPSLYHRLRAGRSGATA